jgi:hypothetical protein
MHNYDYDYSFRVILTDVLTERHFVRVLRPVNVRNTSVAVAVVVVVLLLVVVTIKFD